MSVSDWLDLMPATITHASVATRDTYGKASYGSPVSYRARVVYKMARVANRATGQDEIASGQVWIAGLPIMAMDDRILLPDGTSPPIITWEQISDESGPHHTKVYFGATSAGFARA